MSELIKKQNYHVYFDDLSKFFENDLVEIEVMGLKLGDQIEADYITLNGMTYEPKEDILFLYLADELEHTIRKPVEIYVDESEFGVDKIAIKCAQGHLHLVTFKHAVPLKK
jgi:uncharacterized protein YuzE